MIDLCNSTLKSVVRVKNAIRRWDERREKDGLGAWDVLLSTNDLEGTAMFIAHKFAKF